MNARQKKAALRDFKDAGAAFIEAIEAFIADAGDCLTPQQGISLMTSRDETIDTVDRAIEALNMHSARRRWTETHKHSAIHGGYAPTIGRSSEKAVTE